ncbi:hypothetical protein SK128_003822 [Halocaridina rubra]|uniref:Ig-like domain-containing protein n=1 Tax=Halocaridina rubra TaxID=373956 RepID=A0AAN8WS23_HALRR
MSRTTLIALCLVAGVATSLAGPSLPRGETPVPEQVGEGEQPKITYSKETLAKEGERVKLDCAVEGVDLTGVEGFGVSWSKIDEQKPTNSYPIAANDKVLLFSNKYSVDHPPDSYLFSLIIKEINEEDAGLYRCTVNFGEDQKINADVPVKLEKAPYFTDNFTKTLTVTEGDAISIDCQPGGSPRPDVYWERLNQELPYYGGRFFKANQLDIPLIERSHEGHYVCYADNGIGDPANSHIILEVQFAPVVRIEKPQLFASSGDSVTMTCRVEAHPVADVVWYKDGLAILGGANRNLNKVDTRGNDPDRITEVKSTLSIAEVSGEEDFGTYTCKAVNTIGKTERTVEVRLKSPPRIINQSKKEVLYELTKSNLRDALPVVIECEAEGNPDPNYRWNRNGEPIVFQADPRMELEPGTGNLLISDPTLEDNGLYQCFAYNELGTATSDPVYLINSTSIRFTNTEANKDKYDVEAELGRPFKLSCPNVTSYPEPSLSWVKAITHESQIELKFVNDERVVADPYGNLWFTHVTSEDATTDSNFKYMCLASTEFEPTDYSIGSIIELNVVPPKDGEHNGELETLNVESFEMYTSPSNTTFMALEENTLWCIFGGEPSPNVNWRRTDDGELDETRFVTRNFGRTLVFKNTQLSDSGEYECSVSNGVGEPKYATMFVNVEQSPTFIGDLASQTVKEGSTVTFTCEAEATEEINYTWLFNGRPLSETAAHPRRTISSSKLVITDVTFVDIGNYACNATSNIGYAYGQATLNVIPGERRVSSVTSSAEVAVLRGEVQELRETLLKIHSLVVEQLEVSKTNNEKLHQLNSVLESQGLVKQVETAEEEVLDMTEDETTEAEPTTEIFFSSY